MFPISSAGDSIQVWTTDSKGAVLLSALLSSLICDFAARFKVGGTNLNFFIAEQIPVLSSAVLYRSVPWCTGESLREWLLPRVLELTYSDWALQPFAADCGWDGPPLPWDDYRRFLLRSELDAAFFHLYLPADENGAWRLARRSNYCAQQESPEQLAELKRRFHAPRDAVAYIIDTFPIVRRKDKGKHGEYRTKRGILESYDAMQASVAIGESYETRLSPSPTEINCCHPPRGLRGHRRSS